MAQLSHIMKYVDNIRPFVDHLDVYYLKTVISDNIISHLYFATHCASHISMTYTQDMEGGICPATAPSIPTTPTP